MVDTAARRADAPPVARLVARRAVRRGVGTLRPQPDRGEDRSERGAKDTSTRCLSGNRDRQLVESGPVHGACLLRSVCWGTDRTSKLHAKIGAD